MPGSLPPLLVTNNPVVCRPDTLICILLLSPSSVYPDAYLTVCTQTCSDVAALMPLLASIYPFLDRLHWKVVLTHRLGLYQVRVLQLT